MPDTVAGVEIQARRSRHGDPRHPAGQVSPAWPAVLSYQPLKPALEAAGLLVAEPYSRRPPRMRYALTSDGRGLATTLSALSVWGAGRHPSSEELGLRHDVCGTPLELTWRCPTCEEEVDLKEPRPDATLDEATTFNA